MYTNVAYLHNSESVVKDLSVPLLISSCGYYKIVDGRIIKTNRPKGRRDYQLLYIAEGKGRFYFNGEEKIVEKGNIVLFRPMQPQSYFYYPSDKCEVYWVHFTGHSAEGLLKHYNIPDNETIFFAGITPDYQWIFNQMIRELQLCRIGYEELLGILFRHCLTLIRRNLMEKQHSTLNEIERAVHYFNNNFHKPIDIKEYARSLNMSTCWFIRKFKEILKTSPLQYIIDLRIINAKILLETTDMNVSETASAIGYDNVLYFSRLFTKQVGISPSEYKKRHAQ